MAAILPHVMRKIWLFLVAIGAALSCGCSTLSPEFETPSVRVLAVRPLAGSEVVPRFEIDLLVVNPNAVSLPLRGVSYRLFLNNLEVVEGVANSLPEVPAYGEADFTLPATVSLIDSLRFVSGLLRGDSGEVRWRFDARLDVGALLPRIRVEESGALRLDALDASP